MSSDSHLLVVHSSDLHLGRAAGDDLGSLRRVLRTAGELGAQVLILAGDTFDHNRVPEPLLDDAARLLADVAFHVVILPGNHDCLVPQSVYRSGRLVSRANLRVLGVSEEQAVLLPHLGLEVWGRPHLDYANFRPLEKAAPRTMPRRVVAAHGLYVRGPYDLERSWQISDDEISATDGDYIALGHLDIPTQVGTGPVPAYYSGSPDIAKTVNVIHFNGADSPQISRAALR